MPEFKADFLLPQSPQAVFEFHANTANLLRMIPEHNRPELVAGPATLTSGSEFELKVTTFGVIQQLRFKVTRFESPRLIVDEQLKGPFRSWVQTHEFEPAANGGTRLVYRVEFEPPGGMLGFVVTAPRVIAQLEQTLPIREQRTRELLGAAK
jgi:ligand-binding SRPBCC domain-containing protein